MTEKATVSKTSASLKPPIPSPATKVKAVAPLNSPYDQVTSLQRTLGNQAVQRLFKAGKLQAALKIGQPNDTYEQEADRVTDQVMRMPTPLLSRKCSSCAKEEELNIRRKPESSVSASSLPSNFVSSLGAGQPLDRTSRDYFEPRFGTDFSQVRVHTGQQAAQSAGSINALAYTLGNNVIFGAEQYRPETMQGKRLLAHELTHVVQQSPVVRRKDDEMGLRLTTGQFISDWSVAVNKLTELYTGVGMGIAWRRTRALSNGGGRPSGATLLLCGRES